MNAFAHFGEFIGLREPERWGDDTRTKPPLPATNHASHLAGFRQFLESLEGAGADDLYRKAVNAIAVRTNLATIVEQWPEFLRKTSSLLEAAIEAPRGDVLQLRAAYDAIEAAPAEADFESTRRKARRIRYQLFELVRESTVIEVLANRQFLPRYGFPIGLQPLKVLTRGTDPQRRYAESDPSFHLERSGLLAMTEYVPGSTLIVGGARVTSRGLLKHFTGVQGAGEVFGQTGTLCECTNEHVSYVLDSRDVPPSCTLCQARWRTQHAMIVPRHGYATSAYEPPKRKGAWRTVGRPRTTTVAFAHGAIPTEIFDRLGGVDALSARYLEQGEVLAFNRGEEELGFALCTRCGHSTSETTPAPTPGPTGNLVLPRGFKNHRILDDPGGALCATERSPLATLRHQVLAAHQLTDVLLVDLSRAGVSSAAGLLAPTLGHALRIAGAKLLEVDSRELGVLETYMGGTATACPVLYDNVAGGVGHVLELAKDARRWLEGARDLLRGSVDHDRTCSAACLECILTFDSQHDMARGRLGRRVALQWLDQWLGGT